MTDHLPALAFLAPFAAAVSLPLVGHLRKSLCRPVAMAAVAVMFLLTGVGLWAVFAFGEVRYSLSGWEAPIGIEWVADEAAAVMIAAISFVAAVSLLYAGSIEDSASRGRVTPYYTMILLLLSGLVGAVYAADLFNIFVFLEVVALAGYALVALAGGRALIAAFRYLIVGALATTFYLLGLVYFYAATGALNIADLGTRLPALLESKAVLGGMIFIFIGLAIKMALVPLHAWLPDAYARAPNAVTPLLAGLLTKIALLVWIRIQSWAVLAERAEQAGEILAVVAGLGILASVGGALLALGQRALKRIFAYAGISHVGLVLIGASQGNQTGLAGGLFYLANDAVMQCGLFVLAGVVAALYQARSLEDVGRTRIRNPWLLTAFVVVAIGMVGLPPTGGFFGKWYILLGALEAGNYPAAAAIVVTTVLTLAYMLRILERLFRNGGAEAAPAPRSATLALRVSMAAPAAAVIGLGICSDSIISALLDAVSGLGL